MAPKVHIVGAGLSGKELLRYLPGRNAIMHLTVTHPLLMLPITGISSLAVTGYGQGLWCREIMKGPERVR